MSSLVGFNVGVDLTRSFSASQFARALESWDWADVEGKQPIFTSPFGDVFFRAADGFWFLDLLQGKLTRPWQDADALKADLNTPEGQDRYLLGALALAAERQGIIATASQVLGFKAPPILGGPISVENVEAIDFVVSLHIAGQLHQQVRALPPGTPISGFTVEPEPGGPDER